MINEKDTSKEKTLDEIDRRIVTNCIDDVRYIMFMVGTQESDNIKADVEKAISKLEEVVNIDKSGFATKTIHMLEKYLVDYMRIEDEALDVSDEIDKLFDGLKSTWGEADEKR